MAIQYADPKIRKALYIIPPFIIYMFTGLIALSINLLGSKDNSEDTETKQESFNMGILGLQDSTITTERKRAYEMSVEDSVLRRKNSDELFRRGDASDMEELIKANTAAAVQQINEPTVYDPYTNTNTPSRNYTSSTRGNGRSNVNSREAVDNYFQRQYNEEENRGEVKVKEPTKSVATTPKQEITTPTETKPVLNDFAFQVATINGGNYKNNQSIKLRVVKEVVKGDIVLKKGSFLTGTVSFDREKVYIKIVGSSISADFKQPFYLYDNGDLGMGYITEEENGSSTADDIRREISSEAVGELSRGLANTPLGGLVNRASRYANSGKKTSYVPPQIYIQENFKLNFK